MATGTVCHEIQVLSIQRISDSFQSIAPRIGNRCRRQAFDNIGIIGRFFFDIRLIDRAVCRFAASAENTVNNCRIGLQAHTGIQTIYENRSHMRTLGCHTGFLLNDGSQCHKFIFVFDRKTVTALGPHFIDQFGLCGFQTIDHFLTRCAACEAQRICYQTTFNRQFFRQVAGKQFAIGKTVENLLDGQAFRNGH